MENSVAARRYASALQDKDLASSAELLHEEVEVRYPQSGEVFRGRETYLAMLANHPEGLPDATFPTVSGSKASVHVTSPLAFGMPQITVEGSGSQFIIEGTAEYADGHHYNIIVVLNMRDGLVARETWYWSSPFPPPDWRSAFAETDA